MHCFDVPWLTATRTTTKYDVYYLLDWNSRSSGAELPSWQGTVKLDHVLISEAANLQGSYRSAMNGFGTVCHDVELQYPEARMHLRPPDCPNALENGFINL
jgi:hypothetical protein